MNLYYIAFLGGNVIAYGNSGDGVSFPQPNDSVQTYPDVPSLNTALAPYGYVYNGE